MKMTNEQAKRLDAAIEQAGLKWWEVSTKITDLNNTEEIEAAIEVIEAMCKEEKEVKTIQLQSIGKRKATEAKNIKVGDTLIWNFGATEKVTSIDYSKTGKTMFLGITCESGWTGTRRISTERLVAIQGL